MFPMPMPEMPQEIMDAIGADPGGFAEAMGQGMGPFKERWPTAEIWALHFKLWAMLWAQ